MNTDKNSIVIPDDAPPVFGPSRAYRTLLDRTPAGRLADPTDVGDAVVLLCSPWSRFVTGQTLVVDGGYSMFGAAHPASRLPVHGRLSPQPADRSA